MHRNPIITRESKVCAMGSCFADEMGWCLREHGVNIGNHGDVIELKHVLYRWGTFFNPKNLADCLDRLINNTWELEDRHFAYVPEEEHFWYLFMKIRANSPDVSVVKEKLREVEEYWRSWLREADTVILTLGLVEAWIDKENGRAWQGFLGNTVQGRSYDDRAEFKVLSYEECLSEVRKCIDLVNGFGKKKNIIVTVSPVPLEYTFRDVDVIVANRYSKSVLRVVAEIVTQEYDNAFYFPSMEVVTDCVGWPNAYKEDKRHVRIEVFAETIAPLFIEHFCDF
ncbi:GSCFA domain-containing protein [Pseudomonadota bacterium]